MYQYLLALILLFLLWALNKVRVAKATLAHIPGPPEKSWLFGNIGEEFVKTNNISKVWVDWSLAYGPVSKVRLLERPMVIVSDPNLIQKIFVEGQNNYRGEYTLRRGNYNSMKETFGKCVATEYGSNWKWRKDLLIPSFSGQNLLENILPFLESRSEILTEYIVHNVGKVLDMNSVFLEFTLEIISFLIFGREIPVDGKKLYDLLRTFIEEEYNIDYGHKNPVWQLKRFFGLDPIHNHYLQAKKEIFQIWKTEIELSKKEIPGFSGRFSPMIHTMLKHEKYDLPSLLSEIAILHFAGHDTTTHTLSFILSFLDKNPKKYKKLVSEIDLVLYQKGNLTWSGKKKVVGQNTEINSPRGPKNNFRKSGNLNSDLGNLNSDPEKLNSEKISPNGEEIEGEDYIGKLPYLTGVIRETLRIYPIAWSTLARTTRKIRLGDYDIPPEVDVLLVHQAANQNPAYFHEPEKFIPERYIPGSKKETKQPFVSFALGAHGCLGKNLAYLEMKVVLSTLLRKVRFVSVPGHDYGVVTKITLGPAGGMPLIPVLRE